MRQGIELVYLGHDRILVVLDGGSNKTASDKELLASGSSQINIKKYCFREWEWGMRVWVLYCFLNYNAS